MKNPMFSSNPADYAEYCDWAEKRIAELEAKNAKLKSVLRFYADPGHYFAMDDLSDCDDWLEFPYGREMPGKRARIALKWERPRDDE